MNNWFPMNLSEIESALDENRSFPEIALPAISKALPPMDSIRLPFANHGSTAEDEKPSQYTDRQQDGHMLDAEQIMGGMSGIGLPMSRM
jgi:hypothetical protein